MRILGWDSRSLPSLAGPVDYKCVLVQYHDNEPVACCVLGIGDPEWVARYGHVITYPEDTGYWWPNIIGQLKAHGLTYQDNS